MVPECLAHAADLNKALSDAEKLRDSLLAMPAELRLDTEVVFLDGQIADLKQKLSDLDKETEKIYQLLQERDNRAYLATVLHFKVGLKWETVAEFIGGNREAVKMTSYCALDKLFKEGMIL